MNPKEELMYKIMGCLYQEQAPIVFKGALITKLVLAKSGFDGFARETKDIDADWTGEPPTMKALTSTIDKALSKGGYDMEAIAYREYGERQSAGVKIVDKSTGDEVVRMDIDVKPSNGSVTYWYGNASFKGTTVNQILCDKLSSLSGDKIFRRVKDMVDVFALSKCVTIKTQEIYDLANSTGRVINGFNAFLTKPTELEHAYGKLRGVDNKPTFSEVYEHLKKFVSPFVREDKNAVWKSGEMEWGADGGGMSLTDWKAQIAERKAGSVPQAEKPQSKRKDNGER